MSKPKGTGEFRIGGRPSLPQSFSEQFNDGETVVVNGEPMTFHKAAPPGYAINYAVRPTLRDVLHRIRWADIEGTPPTVLNIGTGETIDIYRFLEGQGFRESRLVIDQLIGQVVDSIRRMDEA